MMFQKGSKVEVMNKMELPTSWCVAEVVSGNRHTYNLRYNCFPGVEKVSREFIRPCPPRLKDLSSWVAGDIVEVFDHNSWKTATVCSVSDEGHFSTRLHGFAHEINVYESNIRTRQSWKDGRWVPIVKISGRYGNVNVSQMAKPNGRGKLGLRIPIPDAESSQENDDNVLVYVDAGLQESRVLSSKTMKRASPFSSSYLEDSPENAKNFKTSKKEKVDAFTYASSEDKKMKASFYNTVNGYHEKERISEPNESDDDDCSVGSCSIFSNGPNKWPSPYVAISSDAESFNTSRDDGNYSSTPEEGVAESIHRLELHAYRSTLDALYASGPLSWEKEALLTNLRINLHVSNDEHLTELRNLISVGAGILV